MDSLPSPEHNRARNFLRKAGIIVVAIGLLLMAIGMISFFSSFGGFERPKYFWCCFIGVPILFVGTVMCQFGFLGAVSRYFIAEQAPVAKDTINYMAENTQQAVKTTARAAAEGIKEGLRDSKDRTK